MNKFLALIGLLIVTYVAISLIMPSDDEIRASRVISDCWDEELKICKDEEKGDACTFGVYKLCAAKHPEMYKIFDKRLAKCSERYSGTPLDNPDIWECAGAENKI